MSKVVYLNNHLKKFRERSEIKVDLDDLRGLAHYSKINNEDKKTFNKKVNFKTSILSYKLKTDYIEDTLVELEKCLENSNPPISGNDCDNCRWFDERKNINI